MPSKSLEPTRQSAERRKVEYMLKSGVPAHWIVSYLMATPMAARCLSSGLGADLDQNGRVSVVHYCAEHGRSDFITAVLQAHADESKFNRSSLIDQLLSISVTQIKDGDPVLVRLHMSQSVAQVAARYGYAEMLKFALDNRSATTRFDIQPNNVFDTLLQCVLIGVGGVGSHTAAAHKRMHAECIDLIIASDVTRGTPFDSLMTVVSMGNPVEGAEPAAKKIYAALLRAGRLPAMGISPDDHTDEKRTLLAHALQGLNRPLAEAVIDHCLGEPRLEPELDEALKHAESYLRASRSTLGEEMVAYFRSAAMERRITASVDLTSTIDTSERPTPVTARRRMRVV